MARKLLINNYIENGLMPATDGLICWLDGRDGNGQDTIWSDRSRNGNDFELRGFTFSGDDGWTGNNLKVNFEQVAIKENFSLPEEYTIEIDMFMDAIKEYQSTFFYFGDGYNSGKWRECLCRDNGGSFQIIQSSQEYHIHHSSFRRYNLTIMGKRNMTCLYIDNVKIYTTSINQNVLSKLTANFYLGCGNNLDKFCKARLNSVRVYNRILTEEEINRNYQYEQSIQRGE